MSINRSELKSHAKQTIHDSKPSPVWITLVYILVIFVLDVLVMSVSGELEAAWTMIQEALAGNYTEILPETTGFGNLLSLLMQVMSMVLAVGYSILCLRLWRQQDVAFANLLDGFGMFFRVVALSILKYFIILGWSMAYALPAALVTAAIGPWGLVITLPLLYLPYEAMYSYRLAVFLMIDYPTMPSLHCLSLSRKIMKGYKWQLFKLDLSFLGWLLLCLVPFVGLWVRPYMETVNAGFYERVMDLSGWRARFTPPTPGPDGETN